MILLCSFLCWRDNLAFDDIIEIPSGTLAGCLVVHGMDYKLLFACAVMDSFIRVEVDGQLGHCCPSKSPRKSGFCGGNFDRLAQVRWILICWRMFFIIQPRTWIWKTGQYFIFFSGCCNLILQRVKVKSVLFWLDNKSLTENSINWLNRLLKRIRRWFTSPG